tara:strand:- start:1318 stop:1818 length:501 start_codon:yes stop_codon:yes gene_type:complete
MGKTYRNVYKHPDSESMFGSPHNRGFARSKKRHSHHAIRNQNKKKNINEYNIQTHFKHRKVNEYFGHTKPDKIGNVPNFPWMNLNDTIKQIGENYHKKADINQWTKQDGDIVQTIDNTIDKIHNSPEPQCRLCYENINERYLNATKKQIERRGKAGAFKGHRRDKF